jgi:hypothetical protein
MSADDNSEWRRHSDPEWWLPSPTPNPDLERFTANRTGAQTIEVKASHLSMKS